MKRIKKVKPKTFIVLISLILILFWIFNPFLKTEIVCLHHLSEINPSSNDYDRIFLVKNPPKNAQELKKIIQDFETKSFNKEQNFNHLYIKKHKYILFPAIVLTENIDYSDKKTTRDDLDNSDFIASSSNALNFENKRIVRLDVYVGEHFFYKY